MRAVIQRVSEAKVTVGEKETARIKSGLLVLLGVEAEDTSEDIDWLASKISRLRIFSDSEGNMNLSLMDAEGDCIVVSQFTLHASTKKGNRPSFIKAAKPDFAQNLYTAFIEKLESVLEKKVQTGIFGAMMKVSLINDGPVTIIMDSKNKE